jgi:imidazolonepropionase-like amidohydrolase
MPETFDYARAFPNPPVVRDALLPQLRVKPWIAHTHEPFYLTHATIIDTTRGELMKGEYVLLVEGGEIQSMEAQGDAHLQQGIKQTNVEGKFVCPGLIDAHVHVCAVPGVEVST